MKYGMPTLVELDNLKSQIELCKKLNLDFIELNMNLPEFSTDKMAEIDFLSLYQEGIDFTIHLAEDMDLASFEPEIRNAYIKVVQKVINIIPENTINKLNMHINKGVYFTLPDRRIYLYEKYHERFQENLYNSFEQILGPAEEKNIKILIENEGNTPPYIQTAVDELLNNNSVFLTWDIGHDAACAYLDTPFYEKHQSQIKHIHLHDALNTKNHLELYTGDVDIDRYLRLARNENIDVVIETKTVKALKNSVKKIQK